MDSAVLDILSRAKWIRIFNPFQSSFNPLLISFENSGLLFFNSEIEFFPISRSLKRFLSGKPFFRIDIDLFGFTDSPLYYFKIVIYFFASIPGTL